MSNLDQARATQRRNIEAKTGQTMAALRALLEASGKTKHGERRTLLMERFGLGYGDANAAVHFAFESDGQSAAEAAASKPAAKAAAPVAGAADGDEVLDTIYSGKKAALRPIHDVLMAGIGRFGEFEIAPKKGYLSLRRKKQFAMLGPATNDRFELGLNMPKGRAAEGRLEAEKPGGMCSHKVKLTAAAQADAQVLAWVHEAFDAAG